MKRSSFRTVTIALAAAVGLASVSCARQQSPSGAAAHDSISTLSSAGLNKGNGVTMTAVRFLEDRVNGDPDDLIALNKLANYYLQLYRETSDVTYLNLSLRAANSSLRVAGVDQNLTGLLCLAQAEYAMHDFTSARENARELTAYAPAKAAAYGVLGDSLLELGDYDEAVTAYNKLEALEPGSVTTETRLGHLAMLRGDAASAQHRYANALAQAKNSVGVSNETIAWCHWQLGETAFMVGDYENAERHDRDALKEFPNYVRALASLGRGHAALGDRSGAIEQYEHALRLIPDPQFLATLGDLYKLAGREREAANQYLLVEKIGRLNELNGALYNRQLAVFYADHDLQPAEAYASALREYAVRHDIYGADAVAWTALKAGKIAEAQSAIKEALRLGTKDARLFYHAGMIARAAGDKGRAVDYLRQALALNPHFDSLQAPLARKALEQ
jgi:tetratricopeptide (TPR) repeat protein